MESELELDERADGGTTMTVVSPFASTEAMTPMLEMGMEDDTLETEFRKRAEQTSNWQFGRCAAS